MKRRTFFQISIAAAAGSQFVPFGSAAAAKAVPVYHVLTGVDATTSPDFLKHLLWVFATRKLPVGCIVDPEHSEYGSLTPDHPVAKVIQDFLETDPGLLDIIAYVPEMSELTHFFQARRCADSRAALQRAIGPSLFAGRPVTTLACRQVDDPRAPDGARSAGFRNVITLSDEDAAETTESWSNGIVRSYGGHHIDLSKKKFVDAFFVAKQPHRLNLIDTKETEASDFEQLTDSLLAYTVGAVEQEQKGNIANLSIADLQFRDNYRFERLLSLVLRHDGRQSADPNFREFAKELSALGLPFHMLAGSGDQGRGRQTGYWVVTDSFALADDDVPPVTPISLRCDASKPTAMSVDGPAPASAGVGIVLGGDKDSQQGLDLCGNLTIPAVTFSRPEEIDRTLSAKLKSPQDMVLQIDAAALSSKPRNSLLLKEIESIAHSGFSRLVSLNNFARVVMPHSASIRRQRLTQAAAPKIASSSNKLSQSRREALLEDAAFAWRYIENNTHPHTGLVKPTQNLNETIPVKQFLTMWDIGSHINALVAAQKIGLIDKKEFDKRISKILPQIRGRRSQERLLPQGYIRVDRDRWGIRDFDGCDTGRLLASLDNLRRNGGPVDRLEELVASWDLDKIVVDGVIHSVISEELVSTYKSHCTHYAARAFRIWGHDVKSPYDVMSNASRIDDEIALLEAAGWIGPIGAEPLLLEAIEIGQSQESSYLADVLFAAQLEEFMTTGILTSVSESPINKPPWFVYNGLLLDKEDLKWSVDVVGGLEDYSDPVFQAENRLLSTKAAYLWAAYHPHGYSNLLVSLARKKARTEHGFLSAIFTQTGEPTKNYLDLNTNAIILQAIAYALENG